MDMQMWTEKLSNVVFDHGCKRCAVCELYRRTHAQIKFLIEHTNVGLTHARPIRSWLLVRQEVS